MFLRVTQLFTLLAFIAYALHVGVGVGGEGTTTFFNDYVYNALVVSAALSCLVRAARVREHRGAWLVIGAGLLTWSAAEIYNTFYLSKLEEPPYPSLSDALWLSFYPATYVAMLLLMRNRMNEARASLWLDGLVAALAVAAVGEVAVFHPVSEASQAAGVASPIQVATDFAYPIGDMLMLALVMGVFALTAWRPGRAWTMIGLGLATMAVADSIYAYQASQGTYVEGRILDALWPAATLLVGYAAWEPTGRRRGIELGGWRALVLPVVFALPSLGVLVYDHWATVDGAAVLLATVCMVAVIVRTAMTFGENMRMLANSRREALTDALTGLGNRRRLMLDLDAELQGLERSQPRALALFDLDGFKRYNDNFGHPAGDALLARLGRSLEAAVRPYGRAYRLGGDEFCALVATDAVGSDAIVAAAMAALTEHGKGFMVSASYGLVMLPFEAEDPSSAMQIADQRLYGHKGARRSTAIGQQTRDVLLQVLHERQPDLHDHIHEVSELTLVLGRKLGLAPEQLDEMARAAELHDVGKMAIPDEILNKPGPLDDGELRFIRQHTIVGERILAAAPALATVARLVRSSHENWDGSGYPDGLAGDEIPLASRIIAVCDAFHAMTSDRPYQAAVPPVDAMAELRRCAGRHFDPDVVEVLCGEVEDGRIPVPAPAAAPVRPSRTPDEPTLGTDMLGAAAALPWAADGLGAGPPA
ncbi:MAG TPA: diguanylate cyclase [Thermoleophilaceae bacterium]|jgi:diguanylate cyclase (GGDEF)-like protein